MRDIDIIQYLNSLYAKSYKTATLEEYNALCEAKNKIRGYPAEIARLTAENEKLKKKTCRNISDKNPVDEFICSKCGFMTEDFTRLVIDEDDGEHINYEYEIKYCPNCGAKVEEEE